jgi:hypothetical protein
MNRGYLLGMLVSWTEKGGSASTPLYDNRAYSDGPVPIDEGRIAVRLVLRFVVEIVDGILKL